MSSKNIAQYVMLAQASYADLTDETGRPLEEGGYDYNEALKKSGFADTKDDGQITLLKDNWSVVANWKDRVGDDWSVGNLTHKESGFSATLFKDTAASGQAGQYVLAGSLGAKDFIIADGGDIVMDGFAHKLNMNVNRNYFNI